MAGRDVPAVEKPSRPAERAGLGGRVKHRLKRFVRSWDEPSVDDAEAEGRLTHNVAPLAPLRSGGSESLSGDLALHRGEDQAVPGDDGVVLGPLPGVLAAVLIGGHGESLRCRRLHKRPKHPTRTTQGCTL